LTNGRTEKGTTVKTSTDVAPTTSSPPLDLLSSLKVSRRFQRSPLQTLTSLQERYGDFIRLTLGGRRAVILNHPEDIRNVLVVNPGSYQKVVRPGAERTLVGDGLLRSEGEFHRRQRRLIQPSFHRQRIAEYAAVMSDYAQRWSERWRDGAEVDMAAEMNALTLAIVAKTLFDANVEGEASAVREALGLAMKLMSANRFSPLAPLLRRLPLPAHRRLAQAEATLDAIVLQIIEDRREKDGDHHDLLATLIEAVDVEGDGTGMTDQQLRDEVMTLFVAGHETTSNWLTWTWYLLAQYPEVAERLHGELKAVLGDRPATFEDVPQLPYTRLVLTESLRVYPPVWTMARQAATETEIRNVTIPTGTIVLLSQWVVHHDSRWYADPYTFDPERWRDLLPNLPRLAFFPFGAGPRICIGEPFAWMEATLILATLIRAFRADLAPNQKVIPEPLVTLRPKGGLPMTLSGR